MSLVKLYQEFEEILDALEVVTFNLAEAHALDKAAEHYIEEQGCAYCQSIDNAMTILNNYGKGVRSK